VKDAHDELYHLDEEQRKQHKANLERLDRAIAYTRVVLEATQPEMLTATTADAAVNAALQIANNPAVALEQANAYAEALINAVALIPLARDRDVEQQVKNAAAKFQQSASQRLNALEDSIKQAREQVNGLKQTIDERASEASTQISGQVSGFETRIGELEHGIATQRQQLDEQITRQTTTFNETQEERSKTFAETLESFRTELSEAQVRAQEEIDQRVSEIRRMEEESAQLVGAIGLAGTAERYSVEAREQCKAANRLRWATVIVAFAAVGMAVYASLHHETRTQTLTAKLTVSLILGGVAAYLARQSARHRRREEHARALQLELTAFSPFIEPLTKEQQEEERVIMTRKTFGKTTATEASEEEPGPAPLSFMLQRRQKELQEGQ
jgi:predicted phage tail protein